MSGRRVNPDLLVYKFIFTKLTSTAKQLDQTLVRRHIGDVLVDAIADTKDVFLEVFGNNPSGDQPFLQLGRMDVDRNVCLLNVTVGKA
jgi:hypothetical protein